MLREFLLKNRSYRRFYQDIRISVRQLKEWVSLTCLCASARNAQPLKYYLVQQEEKCAEVFPALAWAGYLKDWAGPEEGERPAAYIVQVLDTRIVEDCLCDDGLQLQAILLAAVEDGFGGCIIKAFKNDVLRTVLQLPDHLKIRYVVALGKPRETVVLENIKENDYKYWRDADGIHHVPKRPEKEIIAAVL